MAVATLVDDVRCTACRGHGVFVDVTRDGAVVTVTARCYTCDHDYGVVGDVPRSAAKHGEDLSAAGAAVVRERLR